MCSLRLAAYAQLIGVRLRVFVVAPEHHAEHRREEVDLVITAKVGCARECPLGPAHLRDAANWIDEHRRRWEGQLDRFSAYVEERNAARG